MYQKRCIDAILKKRLSSAGAILIRGPKGCGKTETALQVAQSEARLDIDRNIIAQFDINPRFVLRGDTPRLIDEWQIRPEIWNYVRHEVDERKAKGQFILTGSSSNHGLTKLHSGAGRFSIIDMRPMSLMEKGLSTEEVSLNLILQGDEPGSEVIEPTLEELAELIITGGWPGLLGSEVDDAIQFMADYVRLTAEVDIQNVSGVNRDPVKVTRLMQSFARNIATEAPLSTIVKDVNGTDGYLTEETASLYISDLERLRVVEQLPAWPTHLRSRARLRTTPKRHFVDPSLAAGSLALTVDKLKNDMNYFGFLFESLVLRDLRIYAEMQGGKVYHYRDSNKLEVDMIIEYPDGRWAAFEVKMGFPAREEAALNLLAFTEVVDTKRVGEPSALTVITANGFAHRRKDGVNVIPLGTLSV